MVKSGEKWRRLVKSEEKWQKCAKVGKSAKSWKSGKKLVKSIVYVRYCLCSVGRPATDVGCPDRSPLDRS